MATLLKENMGRDEKLGLLQKCPKNQVSKLIHGIVNKLCGKASPRYLDYDEIWNMEEWWAVIGACTQVCRQAGRHDCNRAAITSCLEGLPGDYQHQIVEAVLARKEEIKQTLLQNTANISPSQLNDFDWQLKLVMSSDKMASIQEPLLSMDLHLQQDMESKHVSLELNRQELNQLITSLEEANQAVQQLKS